MRLTALRLTSPVHVPYGNHLRNTITAEGGFQMRLMRGDIVEIKRTDWPGPVLVREWSVAVPDPEDPGYKARQK